MDEVKSKSQKKREADHLQRIGIELIQLSSEKLALLPLTPALEEAIMTAKTLKNHGAVRRQQQLIGKLMRSADNTAILEAYTQLIAENHSQTAAFHEAEYWRNALLTGGKNTLSEFIRLHQPDDIQQLRQLINKAITDRDKELNSGSYRELFRYIRVCINDKPYKESYE